MSLLLGIGLASFFRFVCKDKSCIVFAGPPIADIKDKIYKNHDKCYDQYGFFNKKCDVNIINELKSVTPKSNVELIARDAIIKYFEISPKV